MERERAIVPGSMAVERGGIPPRGRIQGGSGERRAWQDSDGFKVSGDGAGMSGGVGMNEALRGASPRVSNMYQENTDR